jgi:flagellar motor switch protein FliM
VQDDRTWKQKMEQAVLSVPLTLSAELAKPKTTLGLLMKSTVGDSFPMAMPEDIIIKVAGEPVYHAEIGKMGANAAVSMKERISLKKEQDNG